MARTSPRAPPDALLATKLYLPPPRPDLVPRPRLSARLSAGLRGPLTLVVAPAGWGKTTLLSDWRARQQDDAWTVAALGLDSGDNDLARFLRYVVAALQTIRSDIGLPVLASLHSPRPPPVEALLTLLLNDLAGLPGDAVLVLDDYHVIEDPGVHGALTFLLEHLPPRMHLVIATRVDPPLPLARLRARGYLTELRAADSWYRYHHLFAGFLRERLRRDSPDLAPELHRRASQWYLQHGLTIEAVDHALAVPDYPLAASLVEQIVREMLWQRGELATLRRWLEHVPRDVVGTRPRLCLDLAWVMLWSGQPDAVMSWLQDTEPALEVVSPSMRGEVAAIRAELARQQGKTASAIELARQALADLPLEDRLVRGTATGLLAGAYLSSGNVAAASQAYAEAVALGQASGMMTFTLIASGRLVLVQALQGRLREAGTIYRRTLELATARAMAATPAIGIVQIGMGEVSREWNNLDAAEELLRQGIRHCREEGGLAEMALDGYLALTRLLQARGDVDGALALLEQAEALGRDFHVVQSTERVAVARARLWLRGDGVAAAMRWANAREARWHRDETLDYVGLLERLTVARVWIRQARHNDAAALLTNLLEVAETGGLGGCVIEILALQARSFLD